MPAARSLARSFVTGDDKDHDRHHDRLEEVHQGTSQVVGDGAGPGLVPQGRGLSFDPGDAFQHQFGEEDVEVGEVSMQHPLGDARLRGDRPTGKAGDAVSDQHPHGGVEELSAWVL